MQTRRLGNLWPVSALTLGGGGLGQLWGPTTREECVATVRAAVERGITLLDMAPLYGNGEAERVVGLAFDGRLPAGVRVTTKCYLGSPPADRIETEVRASLAQSLTNMRLARVDLFLLHSAIARDGYTFAVSPEIRPPTGWTTYVALRRVLAKLVGEGLIGAWGITGIGIPAEIERALGDAPKPQAVQCIANLLDSAGGLKRFVEPAAPRRLIATACRNGVGVMGIRAVQAGALSDAFDRALPDQHPDMADFRRAAPFRALARALGASPAALAHRYALTMDGIDTVVLGVKNRAELDECFAAEAAGPLAPDLVARIDRSVGRSD
jgi:aryl-alcohol dehydrogenase-like predicted oxidoreductase